MRRRDWWPGVALVLVAIIIGFTLQTKVLLNAVQEFHAPKVRPLASL